MSASQNSPHLASGHGIATYSGETLLDVWFPEPALGANTSKVSAALNELAGVDEVRKVRREVISIEIDLNVAPTSAADAYLRLHLLSHRLIKPHGASYGWNLRVARQRCLDFCWPMRRGRI